MEENKEVRFIRGKRIGKMKSLWVLKMCLRDELEKRVKA